MPLRKCFTNEQIALPLHLDQALSLLRVLDAQIDLTDRYGAALERSETFCSVQLGAS